MGDLYLQIDIKTNENWNQSKLSKKKKVKSWPDFALSFLVHLIFSIKINFWDQFLKSSSEY
jgi:hypothetical protein